MTPYYDHGGIQIYHGDCREILPGLGRFDLLLTDPPYGIDLETDNSTRAWRGGAKGWRTNTHERVAGDGEPFNATPLLGIGSAAVLWGANNFSHTVPGSAAWFVWDKKCGRTESFASDAELAAVVGADWESVRVFRHMWKGYQRDSEIGERVLHPTQKPVALMSWCLGFFPEAKTVVDPYMGSGPVAKACKDRGLKYVGIELVEKYCEIATKRLAQEVLFA